MHKQQIELFRVWYNLFFDEDILELIRGQQTPKNRPPSLNCNSPIDKLLIFRVFFCVGTPKVSLSHGPWPMT